MSVCSVYCIMLINELFTDGFIVLKVHTHLQTVKRAIWEARAEWKAIGRALGLSEGTVDSIKEPNDDESLHVVIKKWLQTDNATFQDLINALEDPTVARNDIANDVRALEGRSTTEIARAIKEGGEYLLFAHSGI